MLLLQAAPEDELRLALGLQNYTSGKGKVELKDSSMRPIEIFMCSVVSSLCCFAKLTRLSSLPQWDKVYQSQQLMLHMQVRRMGYGEGFRWLSQYIK